MGVLVIVIYIVDVLARGGIDYNNVDNLTYQIDDLTRQINEVNISQIPRHQKNLSCIAEALQSRIEQCMSLKSILDRNKCIKKYNLRAPKGLPREAPPNRPGSHRGSTDVSESNEDREYNESRENRRSDVEGTPFISTDEDEPSEERLSRSRRETSSTRPRVVVKKRYKRVNNSLDDEDELSERPRRSTRGNSHHTYSRGGRSNGDDLDSRSSRSERDDLPY